MGCVSGSCGCGPKESGDFDPLYEGPSERDLEQFGGDEIACPSCRESIHDDSPACPYCGHVIGDAGATNTGSLKPVYAVVAIASVIAFVAISI